MVKNPIELRRKKYFQLSSQIAQLDNTQLRSLFNDSALSTSSSGWGINHTIILGEFKVFVKTVPVMWGNKKKDTKFPDTALRLLLEERGLISNAGFHGG